MASALEIPLFAPDPEADGKESKAINMGIGIEKDPEKDPEKDQNIKGKEAKTSAENSTDVVKPKLCPTVAMYGPYTVENLEPGKIKKWCTCGLSKKQPWCDGAHKGTGFKSLKWKVPEDPQRMYSICGCKHTCSPPLCDGSHIDLPCRYIAIQKACQKTHSEDIKLCTGCGWVPQW